MRKVSKDNRSTRRTRSAIRDAMTEMLAVKPIGKITVQELIDKANICRTTFYAHYEDIYDLLSEVENDILSEIRAGLEVLDQAPIRVEEHYPAIEVVVEVYARHEKLIRLLNGPNGDPGFDARLQDTIYSMTRQLRRIKEGDAFDEERHRLYSCYVISGGISVLNRMISANLQIDPREAGRVLGAMAAAGERIFLELDV
jgi:AcrR family transcriptional regulator